MKIGLMLGGGGAKGAYQVGILKAFEELNFLDSIDIISGSSIGALNGYFYLSSHSVDNLYKAWLHGIKNNPLNKKKIPFDKKTKGLFTMDIVKEMAKIYTDEKIFRKATKDLYVILTKVEKPSIAQLIKRWSWEKVTIHLNNQEKPLDYVLSSSSIPIVFGFKEVGEDFFMDGGLSDNNPIDILIEKGCKVIFVSSLERFFSIKKYQQQGVTLIDLSCKEALPSNIIRNYLSVIDFDEQLFKNRVNYGYFVAKKMIEYILELQLFKLTAKKYKFIKKAEVSQRIDIPDYIK